MSLIAMLRQRAMTTLALGQRSRAVLSSGDTSAPSGVMVAFYPDPEVAATLAIDGGEAADELHITLAFLGKADDVADPQVLINTVQQFAARAPAMQGIISGIGRFVGAEPTADAFYVSFDAPTLPEWRQLLVTSLDMATVRVARNHGFTPHMTLAYIQPDADLPAQTITPTVLTFGAVTLKIGAERYDFPLIPPVSNASLTAATLREQSLVALAARTPPTVKQTDAAVEVLVEQYGGQIGDMAQQLQDGDLSRAAFASKLKALLIAAGMEASAVGDMLQQALAGIDEADIEDESDTEKQRHPWVLALVKKRQDYIDGYADDIESGGEDGEGISKAGFLNRAGMWAGIAWSAYQSGRAHRADEQGQTEITWICKDDANSCDDCVELAEGSPYTLDSLPTEPGGDVQCGGNCRCELGYSTPDGRDEGDGE